ncbi:MFS transporter [Streptomyces sp. 846.5]|nr:MFS transporter [Streptomyces sp. 846.5]
MVSRAGAHESSATAGLVLPVLAAGQFLMALDSSVMNVSIATVADDVGTTVTGIQGAITAYTLVMAMFMIPGGKVGALIGRKPAFMIGCAVYGCGSLTTALAPNLPVLLVGWSFLEGVGAALILPAIVALVASNFSVERRPAAYGLVAAAGAVAIALGPLIGGVATTYYSWCWVFAGESAIVLGILVLARRIVEAPTHQRPRIDLLGAVLSALGLGIFVFGVLRSSEWGWFRPKPDAPVWLGISLVVWLMLAGLLLGLLRLDGQVVCVGQTGASPQPCLANLTGRGQDEVLSGGTSQNAELAALRLLPRMMNLCCCIKSPLCQCGYL